MDNTNNLLDNNLYSVGNEWSPYIADYDTELDLFRMILSGKSSDLSDFFNRSSVIDNFDRNNYKNSVRTFVSYLTIAKHACIRAGVSINIVYSTVEKYAKAMEEYRSSAELVTLCKQSIGEFLKLVETSTSHTSTQYSPVINKTIRLITSKFPDRVSLEDAASEIRLSPKYLSSLFVKETGSSFSDFIQDIRIQYAKQLLSTTNMSLLEIANLLNYSSQSYFTHIFKKKTGMTPKDFKNSQQSL